ncbi:hypothetical protein D3C72_1442330 [compost metagenome]
MRRTTPRSTVQSLSPGASRRLLSKSEKLSVAARPSASVTTTCAVPVLLMRGSALSWKGPAGTWPLYWRMPSMNSSTSEGIVAEPMKLGSGAVCR